VNPSRGKSPAGRPTPGGALLDIPLKWLLIAAFLLAGLMPVMIWTIASYEIGRSRLREQAFRQLESVRDLKKAQIERFFHERLQDVQTLATDPSVVSAFTALHAAAVGPDGRPACGLIGLDEGRFESCDAYRTVNESTLPFLARYIRNQGYYDLIFIDDAGYAFFSVMKEDDLGRVHSTDDSALGDAWRATRDSAEPRLTDMKLYAPSRYVPAQFVAARVSPPGGPAGILVLQISIDSIDAVMGNRSGMGRTGETYLVGSDRRLRSDSALAPSTHSVVASFGGSTAENGVDTPAVTSALAGKSDRLVLDGYRGTRVLSAFAPLAVGPGTWAMVAEIEEGEIEKGIDNALSDSFIVMLAVSSVSVLLLALFLGAVIGRHVRIVSGEFQALTGQVLAGNLAAKGDPTAVAIDFRPLITDTNELIAAFGSRMDGLPVPVMMIDRERVVRFANTAAARLCALGRERIVGAPCHASFLCMNVDGCAAAPDSLGGSGCCPLAGAIDANHEAGGDAVLRTSTGDVPVRYTVSPATLPDGSVPGAWLVIVDQTESLRMESEKRRLENQLYRSQRLESLGTLSSGIAHDFNNILSYMLVYADLATTDAGPGSPAQPHLREITTAIERAAGIVRQMLVFSRKMEGRRTLFDAVPVVTDTLALVKAALPPDIMLECSIPDAAMIVEGDPAHLGQIVMNLCSNSRDAIEGRAGKIVLEITADVAGNVTVAPAAASRPVLRLTVTDDGCGMNEKTLEHLFEPFFTTKAPGKGSGLGMAVVHGIVTTWGGTIDVRSQPDHGTTIVIRIPLAEAEPPNASPRTSA